MFRVRLTTYQFVLNLLDALLGLLAVLLAAGDGDLVAVLALRGKVDACAGLLPDLLRAWREEQ